MCFPTVHITSEEAGGITLTCFSNVLVNTKVEENTDSKFGFSNSHVKSMR
jgi:hypothetical protein